MKIKKGASDSPIPQLALRNNQGQVSHSTDHRQRPRGPAHLGGRDVRHDRQKEKARGVPALDDFWRFPVGRRNVNQNNMLRSSIGNSMRTVSQCRNLRSSKIGVRFCQRLRVSLQIYSPLAAHRDGRPQGWRRLPPPHCPSSTPPASFRFRTPSRDEKNAPLEGKR